MMNYILLIKIEEDDREIITKERNSRPAGRPMKGK
jgi:hypothetical protein